jgi:hypothetical protein
MYRGVARILSHRATGWVGCAAALGLAGAFGLTTVQAHRDEAFLRGRIAALASHDGAQTEAELVSCRATVRSYAAAVAASAREAERPRTVHVNTTRQDPQSIAAELAGTPPAGVDVCARMESADEAVLKTLDHR